MKPRLIPLLACLAPAAVLAAEAQGIVVDLNGQPLAQAQVTMTKNEDQTGPDYVSVFTDSDGRFVSPGGSATSNAYARKLGYEQVDVTHETDSKDGLTIVMQRVRNLADQAPASAWLSGIEDRREKATFVQNCVDCHPVPAAEVRAYAAMIENANPNDEHEVRKQSWLATAHYMNYLSAWEFGRANPDGPPPPGNAYYVGRSADVAETMATHFAGNMQELYGYDYGAPLIVTGDTVIREYEVHGVNAIREAMMIGQPRQLWVADVATNRMYVIDVETGEQSVHEVPYDGVSGPHSLHRGSDDSLWITPLFPSVIARVDPFELSWQTWATRTNDGTDIGIHDLSFGYEHELLTDNDGLVWFSDIRNTSVGYFDPETGDAEIYRAPDIEGRTDDFAALYGLVMTSDRKHIWFSQLGIGSFGNFNIETREFETRVVLPMAEAGPRRLTISDDDIMYVPLYGAGQLIEYDTVARREIGTYDLPDTGSAPYAATWDPVRRVVWIATANAGVFYRFDPETKSFGVLPLPRNGAFTRMIDIDPETGFLVSSYANIVEFVKGPRMAFIVDPGDGAYDSPAGRQSQ